MNTDRLLREVEAAGPPFGRRPRGSAGRGPRGDRPRAAPRDQPPRHGGDGARAPGGWRRRCATILEAINRQPSLDDTIDEVLEAARPHRGLRLLLPRPARQPTGRSASSPSRGFPDRGEHPRAHLPVPPPRGAAPRPRAPGPPTSPSPSGSRGEEGAELHPLLGGDPAPGRRSRSSACSASTATASEPLRRGGAAPGQGRGLLLRRRHPQGPARWSKVRRYASLMEPGRERRRPSSPGARPRSSPASILDGALRIGSYAGRRPDARGRRRPEDRRAQRQLHRIRPARGSQPPVTREARRLDVVESSNASPPWGSTAQPLFLVPVATPDVHVGTLVLADPDGESHRRPADGGLRLAAAAACVFALAAACPALDPHPELTLRP